MRARDEIWVVPLLAITFIGLVAGTHFLQPKTWYDSIEDYQISSVSVAELAGWIIEGRNDFLPIYCHNVEKEMIDNIPGLVSLKQDQTFREKVDGLPSYKKWILITPEGGLPPGEAAAYLTQDRVRRVIVLEGGARAWEEKITQGSIADLQVNREEREALGNVRTFFHGETLEEPVRFIAKPITKPPLLEEEEEEEEEEGC